MTLMIVISSILIIAQTIIFVSINKSNKKRKEKEKYTMVDMILYEQNKKMNEEERK
jgi:hypothetical protein